MTKKEMKKVEGLKHHLSYMRKVAGILSKQLSKDLQNKGYHAIKEDFRYTKRGCKTPYVFCFNVYEKEIIYDLRMAKISLDTWKQNDKKLIDTLKECNENIKEQYLKECGKESFFEHIRSSCPTFCDFLNEVEEFYKNREMCTDLEEDVDVDLDERW